MGVCTQTFTHIHVCIIEIGLVEVRVVGMYTNVYTHFHVCIIENGVIWACLPENVVAKQRPLCGVTKGRSTKGSGCLYNPSET